VPDLTPLAIAALGLLNERPMHPYEMYQLLITRAEDRLVKVRPGSLYHAVDRLTRDGFVESVGTDREGNRPERTTYRITEQGLLALSERVSEMIATPINEFAEFPLAISEAHNLSREVLVELLGRRRQHLVADLDVLRNGAADVAAKSIPKKFWIDVTLQSAIASAELAWIDDVVTQLNSGELDWSPEPSTPHVNQKELSHDQHSTDQH
jgi:DNA-binding PadR family transcriptional regulator